LVEQPIFLVNLFSQRTVVIVVLNVAPCRLPMTNRGLLMAELVSRAALSIGGVPHKDRGRQQNYSNKNPVHRHLLLHPSGRPRARRVRSAGGQILYWMPVLGILRMARGLSNPIGFSAGYDPDMMAGF
jgi:hypothetical protein